MFTFAAVLETRLTPGSPLDVFRTLIRVGPLGAGVPLGLPCHQRRNGNPIV